MVPVVVVDLTTGPHVAHLTCAYAFEGGKISSEPTVLVVVLDVSVDGWNGVSLWWHLESESQQKDLLLELMLGAVAADGLMEDIRGAFGNVRYVTNAECQAGDGKVVVGRVNSRDDVVVVLAKDDQPGDGYGEPHVLIDPSHHVGGEIVLPAWVLEIEQEKECCLEDQGVSSKVLEVEDYEPECCLAVTLDETSVETLNEDHHRMNYLQDDGLSLVQQGAYHNMVDSAFRSCRPQVYTMMDRMSSTDEPGMVGEPLPVDHNIGNEDMVGAHSLVFSSSDRVQYHNRNGPNSHQAQSVQKNASSRKMASSQSSWPPTRKFDFSLQCTYPV